jgi:glycosyltransferase involved in cell wall biosynthesis
MFTVIIPIYNAAKYLKKCVDSVLVQTYTDFELLLIDDGSNDGSAEICDSYANVKNVIIYHKSNSGVSATRNFGIDHAHGQWITFIDSDDYIEREYLSCCALTIANESSEISAIFPTFKDKAHIDSIEIIDNLYASDQIVATEEVLVKTNCFTSKSASIYSKLYNTQLLHEKKIKFRNTSINEDSMFNTEYFRNVNKVKYINRPFYHYMIHQDTISLTRNVSRPYIDYYHSCLVMINIYSQTINQFSIDIRVKKSILQKVAILMFRGYRSIFRDSCCYIERRNRLLEYNSAFKPYCKYIKSKKARLFLAFIYLRIPYCIKDFLFIFIKK